MSSRMKAKHFAYPYVVWMSIFVVAPIVLIMIYAFSTREGTATLANFAAMGTYASVFTRSFWLATVSTVICIIVGYPIAYILSREGPRLQRIMIMLIMLPMWMNFLLRTYAWMSILENTGLLNRFLNFLGLPGIRIINTHSAVVVGMVYNFLPFMILPIYSVIVKIDKSVIEAAQDLGANNSTVFLKLILPLSMPGVLSGITMVFVPGVSTFVISQLLGGGKAMLLGDLIELQFLGAAYNPQLGAAISLVMMIIVITFMYIMNRFGEGEEKAVALT